VERNLDKQWDWYSLSCHPIITWEIVERNPEKPWNWSALSHNPNITWKIVQQNPDKRWNFLGLSENRFDRYNAAVRIQRWWRRWRGFPDWRRRIAWVNDSISYSPSLNGADYQRLVADIMADYK